MGAAISAGIMENPVVIRSHGGRARAIAAGDVRYRCGFLGAPSADAYGNANGTVGKATCGSLGYAMIDAKYADKVVIITDTLVPFPENTQSVFRKPTWIMWLKWKQSVTHKGIAKGATRFTKNPKELLIAEYAAKVITNSPYYKEGFSFQTGTGGAALAVPAFCAKRCLKDGIKSELCIRRYYQCNGGTIGGRIS